jgi:hypothetical protein
VIALVAGLSVGDPFIRDEEITGMVAEQDDDDEDDEERAAKEKRGKKRSEWHKVMHVSQTYGITNLA